MNSKAKQQLRVQDRISGLPDELLWHMLSFLETKYAVRTCILSTRWKNIRASVPTMDFDQTSFHDPKKFWAFIDYVLLFRCSSNIKKFRLCLRGNGVAQSRFDALINTVIGLSVVELDLCAAYPCQFRNFDLPKSLVMCKTLTLRIRFTNYGHDTAGYSYFINCPKLEILDLVEEASSTYHWAQAKSVVKARIYLLQPYSTEQPSFQTALLAGACNVTDLCLSAHCFEVGYLPAYENLRQLKMVMIQDCFCGDLLTELLKRSPILESLVLEREVKDCLQKDSDHDKGSDDEEDSESEECCEHEEGCEHEEDSEHEEGSDHEDGSENEQRSDHEEGSEHQWNPPDCVPKCCLLHLKIVSIEASMGNGNELEVAKYLLKYGQVLNKMTICVNHLNVNEKEKIYKEILIVPRGSRTSIIEFI
ncbi:PREDICTED: putative F-box protein At3g58820 [Fragaria vesca subsp. vesca]|uniref:putative F-box protein At3g58820 n=1 Tax=Fragaria vesca subsp. vesca TaxID=101020 RepID=UPI0002C33563|nr:PREDICTED: putative F-box protein At3g58820 [Fragaria vesca subsp. vesca]